MTTKANHKTNKLAEERKETPIVVIFMAVIGAIISYLVLGEIILGTRPHPYHWLSGLVGGILGYFLGWVWYRWKGDIL